MEPPASATPPPRRSASGAKGRGTNTLCARSGALTSGVAKAAKSGIAPASAFIPLAGAEASGVLTDVPVLGLGVLSAVPADDDVESSVVRDPHEDATSTATVHRQR